MAANAFALRFSELDLWSVGSYFTVDWRWPDDEVAPLETALISKKDKVDRAAPPPDLALASLHFDGSIEPRDGDPMAIQGTLYMAGPEDVVYSKIDVRHGAIAVVSEDLPPLAVSSEYPVYRIDKERAVPLYIQLLFRTRYFRAALASKITGASGRKRVNPDRLAEIAVPLPPVPVQEDIVRPWREAFVDLERARAMVTQVSEELDAKMRTWCAPDALYVLESQYFAIPFSELRGWDVPDPKATFWEQAHASVNALSHYAEDASDLVDPRSEPDHEWPVYGVNNRTGVFFSHHQEGSDFNAQYKRIEEDWFFHNPTRSSVGSLGLVPAVPRDALTSPEYQVWRIRDEADLLPEFVAALIETPLFRKLIRIYRSGGVKQRLYVSDLLRIRLPIPDADVQSQVSKQRRDALASVSAAEDALGEVQKGVEAVIIGGPEQG